MKITFILLSLGTFTVAAGCWISLVRHNGGYGLPILWLGVLLIWIAIGLGEIR